MKNQSILQRINSTTPVFEKGVQVCCLIVAGVAGLLAVFGYIPQTVYLMIFTGCGTVAAFAQTASADIATLAAAPDLTTGLEQIAVEIPGQITALKTTIQTPAPAPATVDQVIDQAKAAIPAAIADTGAINAPVAQAAEKLINKFITEAPKAADTVNNILDSIDQNNVVQLNPGEKQPTP